MPNLYKFLDATGLGLLWDKVTELLAQKADSTDIPTNVSQLENDAGYLTVETDPTVPSWAKAQNKPSYTAQEIGAPTVQEMNNALADKIESITVVFTLDPENQNVVISDTSMEVIKAAYRDGKIIYGVLNMVEEMFNMELKAIGEPVVYNVYGQEVFGIMFKMKGGESDLVISGSTNLNNNEVSWTLSIINYVYAIDNENYNARNTKITNVSAPTNNKDAANKQYVDTAINTKYTKPAGGIPASDLEETYLTSFTETDPTVPAWAKAQNKPTYTAQEVGAPTVQEMNTALTAKTELFTVNFTADSEMSTITSDKTIAEIFEAHTQGKVLQGIINLIDETMPDFAIQYIGKIILMNTASTMYACVCEVGTAAGNIIVSGTRTRNQDSWSGRLVSNLTAIGVGGDYSASNSKIINLAAPTANTDAANKKYVDDTVAAFTETDPTVPSWAKAQTKPTYTASEVGAPTVAEMNTAIGAAIGNVHQFELSIVQELPTQDIDTHTIYLVPKTGDTNDVYDEYVYINNAWEMIGNTQIDLSGKADKADTVLDTTLSRGRKANTTVGEGSFAFGEDAEASGLYSYSAGYNTTASGECSHAEGIDTTASGVCSHAEGWRSEARGYYSHASGLYTVAAGDYSHVTGYFNAIDNYDNLPEWVSGTSYAEGDIVKRVVNNTTLSFVCITANSDTVFDSKKWVKNEGTMAYLEIVGNGDGDNNIRSNARALTWKGDEKLAGDLYVHADINSRGGIKVATINDIPSVPVQDVQVNGTSILNNGIANIPVADDPPVVPIFTELNDVWSCNMTFSEVMSALQANNCEGCLVNGSLFIPVTYYYDDPYEGNIQFSCVDMLGTNKFIMKMITYMVGDSISYFERQSNTLDALAKEYSSSDSSIFPVSVGDYYAYNGKLYKANTAIQTAESFKSAKWNEVKVTGELNNLKNDLATKLDAAEAGLKVVRLI